MKRLLGTLLGLLSAQVCCELGPPRMGIWKDLPVAVLLGVREEGKKALKSCRLSIFLIIYRGIFSVTVPITYHCSPFLIRCERDKSGAESSRPESPRGSQFHAVVQFFCCFEHCAVVSPKSRGTPHQPVLHSLRDKADWKINCHNSH